MWSTPYIRKLPDSDEKVAVFLLDTQVRISLVVMDTPNRVFSFWHGQKIKTMRKKDWYRRARGGDVGDAP